MKSRKGWEEEITKGHREVFLGDDNVHYLDGGDFHTCVCVYMFVYQRTSLYTLNMYNILCQLYCNKAIKIS